MGKLEHHDYVVSPPADIARKLYVGAELFNAMLRHTAASEDPEGGRALRLGTPVFRDWDAAAWEMRAEPEGTYCDAWFDLQEIRRDYIVGGDATPTPTEAP